MWCRVCVCVCVCVCMCVCVCVCVRLMVWGVESQDIPGYLSTFFPTHPSLSPWPSASLMEDRGLGWDLAQSTAVSAPSLLPHVGFNTEYLTLGFFHRHSATFQCEAVRIMC